MIVESEGTKYTRASTRVAATEDERTYEKKRQRIKKDGNQDAQEKKRHEPAIPCPGTASKTNSPK